MQSTISNLHLKRIPRRPSKSSTIVDKIGALPLSRMFTPTRSNRALKQREALSLGIHMAQQDATLDGLSSIRRSIHREYSTTIQSQYRLIKKSRANHYQQQELESFLSRRGDSQDADEQPLDAEYVRKARRQLSELKNRQVRLEQQLEFVSLKLTELNHEHSLRLFSHRTTPTPGIKFIPPVEQILETSNCVGDYTLELCMHSDYVSGPCLSSSTPKSLWQGYCNTRLGMGYCFGLKTILETMGGVGSVGGGSAKERGVTVAIQRYDVSSLASFAQIEQLDRQAQLLVELRHPSLISLLEVIHTSDFVYIVTEWAGRSLAFHTSHGKLHKAVIRHIFIDTVKALNALHTHGWSHLNVRPDSIFVNSNVHDLFGKADEQSPMPNSFHVRLGGLDHCRPERGSTEFHSLDITAANIELTREVAKQRGYYFAPEMLSTQSFDGPKADMWFLGVTLLELTFGLADKWKEGYLYNRSDPGKLEAALTKYVEKELSSTAFEGDYELYNLISSLLAPAERRITCEEVLSHPWITHSKARSEKELL